MQGESQPDTALAIQQDVASVIEESSLREKVQYSIEGI